MDSHILEYFVVKQETPQVNILVSEGILIPVGLG